MDDEVDAEKDSRNKAVKGFRPITSNVTFADVGGNEKSLEANTNFSFLLFINNYNSST